MPQKWNLQDIVPPDRARDRSNGPRRTSDMRPPSRRPTSDIRSHTPLAPEEARRDEDDESEPVQSIPVINGHSSRTKHIILAIAALVFFGAVVFGITVLLRGAEVTVYPKNKNITVQATFSATPQPRVGELGYELLSLEAEGERRIEASGQEEVSLRAEGTISIFNAFSTTPQRLIKNTRFETSDGLIYRINDSVVVPGYSKDASGKIIPGMVTATVFADGVGENYNINSTMRLTIPGLKGTDQYEGMYGEAMSGSIKGGFEGVKFVIDDAALSTARQELHMQLRDQLLERVHNEKPAGFVLYESAITFTFDSLPATEAGEKTALIKERAYLRVPLFDEKGLASFIAKNTIAEYDGAPVRLENPGSFTFSYPAPGPGDLALTSEIVFNMTGNGRVIWSFDQESLKKDLAGIAKAGLPTVLGGYPAIERAEAVVRPFWKQSFPEETNHITVTEIVESKQ